VLRIRMFLGLPDPDLIVRPRYGSGVESVGHRSESADPDLYQNVTDPQHCLLNVNFNVDPDPPSDLDADSASQNDPDPQHWI
jgi:hypothetical protein